MLQQTQVDRVIPKFKMFLKMFPTFRALAQAPTAKVLTAWQGLGYNRRALMLHRCAQVVTNNYRGRLPEDAALLQVLPGIGPYTAGAICAFAFNRATPIIETNIRRVYLHHFFASEKIVPDRDILNIVEATMDTRNPRRWYWALMDYGSHLGRTLPKVKNPNRRSRQYVRQSAFAGSARQLRGAILRYLLEQRSSTLAQLSRVVEGDERLSEIVVDLEREGFLTRRGQRVLCI
jgi:A/G-specific adenine glycosylase